MKELHIIEYYQNTMTPWSKFDNQCDKKILEMWSYLFDCISLKLCKRMFAICNKLGICNKRIQ